MKRATVTLPDELQQALDAYCKSQEITPAFTAIMQTALRDYLATRGYWPPVQPLRLTPAAQGSGRSDGSTAHDRILAEE